MNAFPSVRRRQRLAAWMFVVLASSVTQVSVASPPSVPRSELPRIEQQIASTDPRQQRTALSNLQWLEGGIDNDLSERFLPRVLELCISSDKEIAVSSLAVLGTIARHPGIHRKHGVSILAAIATALQSKSAATRSTAMHSLNKELVNALPEAALPLLIDSVEDKDATVRMWAVILLGKSKPNPSVVTSLRGAIMDSDATVRRFAALALAELAPQSRDAMPELLVALRDPNGEVSGSAVYALGRMGEPAFEALFDLADDPSGSIRHHAIRALLSRGMSDSMSDSQGLRREQLVERCLEDPDSRVQASAAGWIAFRGEMKSCVIAIPILVREASPNGSIDGWNAYLNIGRCLKTFATGLADTKHADIAFRGLKQFDSAYLKSFVLEYQQRFRNSGDLNLKPLFQAAAEKAAKREHREFAAQMLAWCRSAEKE
ncbi:MAG: HEAT repeat domain-containing protein [Planctomycetota bacterium]